MPDNRLTIFWIGIFVVVFLLLIELGFKISFWAQGRVYDRRGRLAQSAKVWAALWAALQTIFSRRCGAVVERFVMDGLLHRQLWRTDRYRWVCHFLMLVGFYTLFVLSCITGFFEEILHAFLGVNGPLVEFITNKDTPLMALLNEVLGLMILAGMVLTIVRRFIKRPAQLRTTAFDTTTIMILAVIMLTAYPTEAFRLNMVGTPASLAWFSFLGYPLALLLRPLALHWPVWHYWMFMLHIAACFVLALTFPFSKFFHVWISPIIATANTLPAGSTEAHA